MLKSWLVKKGFLAETVTSVSDAKQMVKEQPFDLILTDIRMPDADGITFLSWVKKYDSDIIVIMITGYADVESAVLSMKAGAADYIPKPIEPEHLFKKIEEAFQTQEYKNKKNRFSNDFILPPGKEYQQLFRQLDQVAEQNDYRLLIGDRGTGKVSSVKYIYKKGIHPSRPLVQLDPDQLGINKNVTRQYTNSEEVKSPLMEKFFAAGGGLLYIRKVDQLDLNLQNELLNILTKQSRDERYTQIIMSTEKSSSELEKSLIPKLFRLLGEKSITLPPIRRKKQVIDAFVTHFLHFANQTLDKQIQTIDQAIYKQMYEYAWPENIQELKNSVIQAALLTEGKHMPAELASRLFDKNISRQENNSVVSSPMLNLRKENYEKEKIVEALRLAKGNKTMAASILNIDRKTLYNKIKLYNVIT